MALPGDEQFWLGFYVGALVVCVFFAVFALLIV